MNSSVRPGDEPAFDFAKSLDEHTIETARKGLSQLNSEFTKLNLTLSAKNLTRVLEELNSKTSEKNCQWLMDQLINLRRMITDELQNKVLLYIPETQARFFTNAISPHLMGEVVYRSFPEAGFDIVEAGACLATLRPTAAVFHVMRVLENGLAALGNIFKVSLDNSTWAPAIEQIERSIRNMHREEPWKSLANCKELQSNYAEAASCFGMTKDAWRNYVMHGKSRYSQAQAERVFANVSEFMEKLARLVSSEK